MLLFINKYNLKLFIKYMVSNRCIMAVKAELKKLHLHFVFVELGEVDIMETLTESQRSELKAGLLKSGLELIDDKKSVLIEKIKKVIIEMVHHSNEIIKTNFSDFLSEKLKYDYTYLANLFSEVQGTTIEQYIISHKIERIKELIIYEELNISEIAWKMNYSSVSHLSNQFKKVTGLSPSHFKQLKQKHRIPIEEIGEDSDEIFDTLKDKDEIDLETDSDDSTAIPEINPAAINKQELTSQDKEKEKLADELTDTKKELAFQKKEIEKLGRELFLANKELIFQKREKEKRAAEYIITDKALSFQTREKENEQMANSILLANNDSMKIASQYLLSLIEASHDPLFTINIDGKITDMNQAAVLITGIPRTKLAGTHFFDYFTDSQKARKAYLEVFAKGSVIDSPLTLQHKNGKHTDLLFNGSVYKDDAGNIQGIVVVARDVTEQKKIAAELTEAIVFAELSTTFAEEAKLKAEKATHIAEDAVKAKQLFLSNMSHEIRTPMNAIIGFTKVILKTELTNKQREYLQAIKLSGDALIVLINDILDLAKVEAGKMTFEQVPFKLRLSLAAMLHLFEPKIQEKNLKLIKVYDESIPNVLVGDPVRLHQIILNLVSNAVKFTSKGKITVSARMLSENERNVVVEFSVEDTGIGIHESKLEKIFENFQQASSGTSRLYGGTGLGLSIVKHLVEAQEGTIQVKSKINEGSCFSFVLSFLKTNVNLELDPEQMKIDREIKGIKVLVVEDIVLNQLLMRTLLDDFGFECEIADNGKIAIEKMQEQTYDLVLMDLQMPVMNGFEATQYIRNNMHLDIPIIALTADVTTADLSKCKEVGMNDYIAKPVDESILYSKMVGLVNKPLQAVEPEIPELPVMEDARCTNLNYLNVRTKSNPILMMEMISLYLDQTPTLVYAMKEGFREKDWNSLYTSVHKMIPSFSIMGINPDVEAMAKTVQEFASTQKQSEGIAGMIQKLEHICGQACEELEKEYDAIKYRKNELQKKD